MREDVHDCLRCQRGKPQTDAQGRGGLIACRATDDAQVLLEALDAFRRDAAVEAPFRVQGDRSADAAAWPLLFAPQAIHHCEGYMPKAPAQPDQEETVHK